MVQRDVDEGRARLDFTMPIEGQEDAVDAAAEVREGGMPTRLYVLGHRQARLTDAERQDLIRGLAATFGDKAERETMRAASDPPARPLVARRWCGFPRLC